MFDQKHVPAKVTVQIFCESSFPHFPKEEARKIELVKEM